MTVRVTRAAQRRVVVVDYDDAQLLDIACVTSTLDIAGRIARQPPSTGWTW